MKAFLFFALFLASDVKAEESNNTDSSRYPKEAIVQLILDHEQLQKYLHPESSGRIPLIVSDRNINPDFRLKKFGRDVRIVSDNKVNGAFLRFTIFNCEKGNYCDVAFEYPIEGVTGRIGIKVKRDGSLRSEKMQIRER